jgi:5'-AMP-activated protein kinase regulatory gamma subunit
MSCAVGPVAQEVVHSLPKAALPAHGLKVDSSAVPLVALLEQMTVNQLVSDKHVITVREDAQLEDVIELLARNRILSVPVVCSDSRDVLGFVDVMDILTFIVRTVSRGHDLKEAQWSAWTDDITTLKSQGEEFGHTPVKDIMTTSRADLYFPVYGQGTVMQAMEHFATGVHRAAVFNKTNKVLTNILTQSDVLQLVVKHLTGSSLGPLSGKTIEELQLGSSDNVICMSTSALAIHAIYLMFFHNVSAVAITDENGLLVSTFSASELRGIGKHNFEWLLLPITVFLRRIASSTEGKPSFPLTCRKHTMIEDAINMLSTYRVHRLWIVDDQGKPEGVLALTDVMRLLLPNDAIPEPAGKPPGRRRSWVEEPTPSTPSSST